jgi:hypothetical protein
MDAMGADPSLWGEKSTGPSVASNVRKVRESAWSAGDSPPAAESGRDRSGTGGVAGRVRDWEEEPVNRSTLARRYAPLVAIAVLQLLIIGFVPSKAAKQGQQVTAGSGNAARTATGGAAAGSANTGTPGATASGPGGAAGGGGAAAGGAPPGADASGDTSHCVNGRTFDPAIAFWAPPCIPGTIGATGVNNGGATYQGVTGDEITLVDYVSNYGAQVNAILAAQGSLVTYDDARVLDQAWEKFINEHYVLYGRHVKIITYQGQCQSVPPNYSCLIPEMTSIVNTYKPYAVNWQTTLCSACYAELARLQTVAVGGTGFSDTLADALKPYFYSAGESATNIEQHFAEWWCAQMTGPVKYAGTQNPAQNFNGKPRVLGIISTNDPDNESTVRDFLVPLLREKCGTNVDHFYFYDQDINTAAKQVAAGIAAMNTPQNPATTVLCLCDEVAPAFLFSGEQSNNYYPENVIATNQGMDFDKTGQSYGENGTLGCPSPQLGCEYVLAMGIGEIGVEEPNGSDAGSRIFAAGGGTNLPGSVEGKTLTSTAKQWIMLANLIQATGPELKPENMAGQAGSLGSVGGPGTPYEQLEFPHGSGFWTQDAKLIYYDKHATSVYNGEPGGYVQVGDRVRLGGWQASPQPPVPLEGRR